MIKRKLILASASSRREELLKSIGVPFTIVHPQCDEHFDVWLSPYEAIEKIAYQKALSVYQQQASDHDVVVIGCDTMVLCNGKALGKPNDYHDAYAMLKQLSGQTHEVVSGVSIIANDINIEFHEVTNVTFYPLSDALVQNYLQSDEAYDKAGSYGIQGKGKLFVEAIQGDYFNVVGLPIARIYRYLSSYEFR